MRRPPRAKNAPILTRRLFARVLFSASIIVVGVLYMYFQQTVEDGRLSKRDQTMVSSVPSRRARL
jgi:Ca2+-transporting ATPase